MGEQEQKQAAEKEPKLSVGRTVQYRVAVDDLGRLSMGNNNPHTVGQLLPAMVTHVPDDSDTCNMRVFADGETILWKTSVRKGEEPGCWNWYWGWPTSK